MTFTHGNLATPNSFQKHAFRVFCDFEFSDFTNPELLSIGLVTEDGRELYIERADAAEIEVSDFVKTDVLPLFGSESPEVLAYEEIGDRVVEWFDSLRGGDRSVVIEVISDSEFDHRLLSNLQPSPAWLQSVNVVTRLVQHLLSGRKFFRYDIESTERHLGLGVQHHALIDSRVMREAYAAAVTLERE